MAITVEGWELVGEHQSARVSKVYWLDLENMKAGVLWGYTDGTTRPAVESVRSINCFASDGEKGDSATVLRALAHDVYGSVAGPGPTPQEWQAAATEAEPSILDDVDGDLAEFETSPVPSDNALSLTKEEIELLRDFLSQWRITKKNLGESE